MSSYSEWIDLADLKVLKLSVDNTECLIAPDLGANLLSFVCKNEPIISYDIEALKIRDYTGTPILYPTPNQVRGAKVTYNGKSIKQIKNGKSIYYHGLVFDEEFKVISIICDENSATVSLNFDFNPKVSFFESFPFENSLTVTYICR